ncbi:MAG: peptidoglycan D,D-transpeptidase FtsI family protein [Planctomycetales bacterium]
MSLAPHPRCRSPWRERLVATGLLVAWLLLIGRLLQLYLTDGPRFVRLASRQHVLEEAVPARPGDIVDRYGHLFATSVTVRSLFVVPSRIERGWDISRQIAEALQLDPDLLFEKIAGHPGRHFLWVKRRLSDDETDRIRQLKLPEGCWGFRDEFRRHYPQESCAAQVIGLRDVDGVGRGGIEQSCHDLLRGRDGVRELVQDARGRVIEVRETSRSPVQNGQTVVLTLDAVVQVYTERALDEVMERWKPKSACAIVLDPLTGDILAMASRPTFDPNQPHLAVADAWKCRAIADIYEPGSTFKPFVVAKALERGCIRADEIFHCEQGEFRMGRRVLHDHHKYGPLSVADILVKSSNIGMAKIGLRLTNAGLHQAALDFGFGRPTGIELPGERTGLVRPLRKWNSYSTGSVPMGQEIAATPLQIIAAYAALSNGGRLISPHLVAYGNPTAEHAPSDAAAGPAATGEGQGMSVVSRAISGEIADWVRREALTAVVSRGTGKKASIRGYDVFGKTGTAQKPDPQTGEYSRQLHVSSFVCGAPADAPRALVMISVDEPSVSQGGEHFGGSVAAPAAGELLRKTLVRMQIPPSDSLPPTAHLPDEFGEEVLE